MGRCALTYKKCKDCGETKDISNFSKNKEMADGHISFCNPCRYKRYARKRAKTDKYWDYQLQWKYGITIEEYNQMLLNQENSCAICGVKPDYRLCVDHRHDAGKVRGLLCRTCNKAIGQLGDTPESLFKAYTYLKETH